MRFRPAFVCVLASCLPALAAGTLSPEDAASPRALLLANAPFRTDRAEPELPANLTGLPIDRGGLLLVQFRDDFPAASRRTILESHRAVPIDPIPRNAWLARVPSTEVSALRADPSVAWIGRFHPAYKLAAHLPESATRLRIRFVAGSDTRTKAAALGATLVESWEDGMRVEVPDLFTTRALAHLDDVVSIEEDFDVFTYNNSSRGICQSGNPAIYSVHNHGVRGQNEIVAIMDTGIDLGHCCFTGANKIADNRVYGGGVLGALCGSDHGTHVSGTAACDNGGDHDGLAPDARIVMQDIQSGNSIACLLGQVSPPSNLATAWGDALQEGARVHSNSWGGGSNAYGSASRAIDQFMWDHPDFLIVFAAGNSGSSPGTLGSYSNAKNSITVGGTVNGSGYENMYSSSSRGPAGDGRTLPDLLAPAQGVSSADNQTSPSCGWVTFSGTSMATPAVAGSAALVREFYREGWYPSGSPKAEDGFAPTAALVKATMILSTRDMLGTGTGGPRPNSNQGFGRLTLDDALWFAGDSPDSRLVVLDDRDSDTGLLQNGEEHVFQLRLHDAGSVKVMLVWTDPPGSTSASKALVDDLDLVVETPDGRTFYGNQGFDGGFTVFPATDGDRLNNKEGVFLASVVPGTVTVRVRAFELGGVAPSTPQDYALVAVAPVDPTCTATPATGPGNSALLAIDGADLAATWAAGTADSYVVYRGDSPDFMKSNPAPYREGVADEDPGTPGVQWTDVGAMGGGVDYYYVFNARNACGEQEP